MTEQSSSAPDRFRGLRFPCSCASATSVPNAPWVAVAKQGKLYDGTKERILNATHRRPRTVSQLAEELDLSPPTVHRHAGELLASELIREVESPAESQWPAVERYYAPNFPIVRDGDRRRLQPLLDALALEVAERFRARAGELSSALAQTGFEPNGAVGLHYAYASAVARARERLEEEGVLPAWPEHRDGSRWVWWAEEPPETEVNPVTTTE